MKMLLTLSPGLESRSTADIVVLDWERKEIIDRYQYTHTIYENSHKGFAGASVREGRLYATTETEVLEFEMAPLRLVRSRSLPYFSDVHHVERSGDSLFLANSGLDTIEELDLELNPKATHFLMEPYSRRIRSIYRTVALTLRTTWLKLRGGRKMYNHLTHVSHFANLRKLLNPAAFHRSGEDVRRYDLRPHPLHVNHALKVGDDIWVTLWTPGEVVSLKTRAVIAGNLGLPHDGTVYGDSYYITDCKTNILRIFDFDPTTQTLGKLREEVSVVERNQGFLRGVTYDENAVYVGLSARRDAPPEFRTARVRALERGIWKSVGEYQIPPELGMSVFSLIDVSSIYDKT